MRYSLYSILHYRKCNIAYAIKPYKVATGEDTFGTRRRLLAIREERKERQGDFAAKLTEAAERLGLELRYTQDMVSKMENGGRTIFIEDVAVVASIDPQRRGKLWLAWNETVDPTMPSAMPPIARGFQDRKQRGAKTRRPGDKSA